MVLLQKQKGYFIISNLIYDIGLYNLIYGNIGLFWSMKKNHKKGYKIKRLKYE